MNLPIKQRPIYSKPRRLAPAEKEIVEKQVALQQWLEEEPIELIVSEYGSTGFVAKPMVRRLCIYYGQLNKAVVIDRNPLPLIEISSTNFVILASTARRI